MRITVSMKAVAAVAAAALFACAPASKDESGKGDVNVSVSAAIGGGQAAGPAAIQAVWVNVYGATTRNRNFNVWYRVLGTGTQYNTQITGIPVGTYKVHAVALVDGAADPAAASVIDVPAGLLGPDMYNLVADPLIYVLPNRTVNVGLTLQQNVLLWPPVTVVNNAPVVGSFVASDLFLTLNPIQPLTLTFAASDADVGDQLTYNWEILDANGAAIPPASGAIVPAGGTVTAGPIASVFTPSASLVPQDLTFVLTVTDNHLATVRMIFVASFGRIPTTVNVALLLNTTPDITAIQADNYQPRIGETATIQAVFDDADGDAPALTWQTSDALLCPIGASVVPDAISFTPGASATCTFTATVNDGKGGVNTGSLTLTVNGVYAEAPPVFTNAAIVSQPPGPWEFLAAAEEFDPLAVGFRKPIPAGNYAWSRIDSVTLLPVAGSDAEFAPVAAGDLSDVLWTPPACTVPGTFDYTIEVVGTGDTGLSAAMALLATVVCP